MFETVPRVLKWGLAASLIVLVVGLGAAVARLLRSEAATPPGGAEAAARAFPGPTGPDPYNRISDAQAYRLRVWGKVTRELSLTLADLQAMPAATVQDPVNCVLGFSQSGLWRGVPLRDVIAMAGPAAEGAYLTIHDDRDFSASLSMDYVRSGKPLLAYEMDGAPLPRQEGWPVRIVAPGKWGYKWVKWVTAIEVQDRGYEGTYERGGFSLNGDLDEPTTEAEKHGR